jgi:DNA-binding response OmpR family regulator
VRDVRDEAPLLRLRCVQRLRAKIEDEPGNPTLIRTVRGVGYRLAPP